MNIDYNFMDQKYQELKVNKTIIFITDINDINKFDVEEFNRRYNDATAFQVTFQNQVLIFIKEVKLVKGFNEINRKADRAFAIHDNENAIKLYRQVLLIKKPSIHVYARLGILYLSQNNLLEALRYLIIATYFSMNTKKKKYDFTYLINKIKSRIEDQKSKKIINIEDFKNDLGDFKVPTRIKEVIILMEFHNLSLEESCKVLNIDEDEKNIITLYLARDCYARNDIEYGNNLLKIVEKSKNKSEIVKRLLQEIRTNRLFYKNRIDDNYKPLLRSRIKTY